MIRFWRWLRRLLGLEGRAAHNELQPSGLAYPSLSVEDLLADLKVAESGARNGSANVPHQHETAPDGQEARIRQEIVRRVEQAKLRASQTVHNLEVSMKARQLAPAVMRCDEIPKSFANKLEDRDGRLKVELDGVQRELAELEAEVDSYRTRHGVSRMPRLIDAEDRYNGWALLIVFTLVQLVANSLLFGQGSDYGLALGITFASIFAFFDILLHFRVGEAMARVRAPDPANRIIGVAAIAFGFFSVLAVNLSMVHLRLVTRQFGVSGWEEWLPSISSEPFGFVDFLSWGLLVVGLLCSLMAVQAGFSWDEPIPLFRRNGRKISRLKEDRDDLMDERQTLKADLFQQFHEELDAIRRDAESHVGIISDSVRRIEQISAEYRSYCSNARETLRALVRSYRDANRQHRSEPPPAFFSEPITLEVDLAPVTSVASLDQVVKQAERDHEELRDILPRARARLNELADVGGAPGGEPDS
jgi:hypothetical protein